MASWRDRAVPVESGASGSWRERAMPAEAPQESKGLIDTMQTPGRMADQWLQSKLPQVDKSQWPDALKNVSEGPEAENAMQLGLIGGQGFSKPAQLAGNIASKPITGLMDTVQAIPGKLKDASNALALKGAGGVLKDFRSAIQKKTMGSLGDFIRENKLVQVGDSIDDVYAKVSKLRDDVGKKIGNIYKGVTGDLADYAKKGSKEAGEVAKLEAGKFHPFNDAQVLMAEIETKLAGKPGARSAINRLNGDLEEMALKHLNDNSIPKAQEIIKDWDNTINYSRKIQDLPEYQQGAKIIRDHIRGKTNAFVEGSDKLLNSSRSKELLAANKVYHNASEIHNMSADKLAREGANRAISLTDTISAGAGAGAGALGSDHTPEGIAKGVITGLLVNKGIRKYGAGVAMNAAETGSKIAKPFGKAAGFLSEQLKRRPGLIGQPLLAPFKKTKKD